MTMHRRIAAALAVMGAIAMPANAQLRVQTPQPPVPPGFQAPNIDPVMQRLNALQAQLKALQQSAGRQVVVLTFGPVDTTSWPDSDNSFPKNNQRAEAMCKEGLGDRYGRVLSRKVEPIMSADRWYFPNLVCETKP